MARIPLIVGAVPLYLLYYLGLLSWWWLMLDLFGKGLVIEGVGVAYLLPTAFVTTAYLGAIAKSSSSLIKLSHFIVLAAITLAFWLAIIQTATLSLFQIALDAAPYLSIGFISGVVTIMTYPLAGGERYQLYKKPLFIGGVIFMPLFIVIAALLSSPLDPVTKGSLLTLTLIGFWASAAWLSSRRTQGEYVAGLEIRPMLPFRPDFILPGGVNYVKGTVLTGLGFMIMSQLEKVFPPPVWNWWGFVLAFWGIIAIIPLRGIYKMVTGRRPRLLGDRAAFGIKARSFLREVWLYLGLLLLMYGFLNAFMGSIPFTKLSPFNPMMQPPHPLYGYLGASLLIFSFLIIVPIRLWYKTHLREGIESIVQLVTKQLLLYLGTFTLIYGFVTLFMGIFMYPHPDTNPLGFLVGLPLFLAGFILIVGFRPFALRNEFYAFLRIMPGIISDLPEQKRREVLIKRLEVLAGYPEEQRRAHMKPMFEGLMALTQDRRDIAMKAQIEAIATLPNEGRSKIMKIMDELMFSSAKA